MAVAQLPATQSAVLFGVGVGAFSTALASVVRNIALSQLRRTLSSADSISFVLIFASRELVWLI